MQAAYNLPERQQRYDNDEVSEALRNFNNQNATPEGIDSLVKDGLTAFKKAEKNRDVSHAYLVAFILSLDERQLSFLQQVQTSYERNSLLHLPPAFLQMISGNLIQSTLLQNSALHKTPKGDYLVSTELPISPGNLVVPELHEGNTAERMAQEARDIKFQQSLRLVPEFAATLLPTQAAILHQVVRRKWPLRYFFISVHENQLSDLENVHKELREDVERLMALRELSRQFPQKLEMPATHEPIE